jgi:DNA-binding CsgD family transcriptional regulator
LLHGESGLLKVEEDEMVRLRSENRTFGEIAASLGRSERSVRRAIEAARHRLPG